MKDETWKPIPGYGGNYDVSDRGQVRSWKYRGTSDKVREDPRILRQTATVKGYLRVGLSSNGHRIKYLAHRLVLTAFVGECPEGMEACHRDGDPRNNRLDNLYWGTPAQNAADKTKHGTQIRGERQNFAKLTEEDVREARKIYIPGDPDYGTRALARRFGVDHSNVSRAVVGKTWKHVSESHGKAA